MQNCLQRNKTTTKGKGLLIGGAMCILALVVASALSFKYNKSYPIYDVNEVYSSSLFATIPPLTEKSSDEYVPQGVKMNNLTDENSKNDVSRAKNEPSCINVRVLCDDGSVREMELEEYVFGCVLGEMPLGFETEALMAQAVAVRTFTVRQMSGKSKHRNADVCTSPACCQNFLDGNSKKLKEQNLEKLKSAVNATKGMIITYDGEPIEAVYHASSGTHTLDSEDVWGGRLEYLRSTPSPEGEKDLAVGVYGHRVGMSQHGANLLAKEGKNYAEILKYYYKGVSFAFV